LEQLPQLIGHQPLKERIHDRSNDQPPNESRSKSPRACWPGATLYLIVDNYSPHKHSQVKAWAAAKDVELVFLPTYAPWLNW
ncbi:transposase, partial [Streptosporangium sp. NPDC023825]|uniref:transposase n=1 Tax=Streptosporangium sp. NPDC023825 TaxID=3154909 RepID=UPI003440E840